MTTIFPEGSRICAYVRDSGGKDQDLSTIQQRESIGKWCQEQGVILSRVFEDAARSGASTIGRSAFLEMMEYFSCDPQEKGLIIWEFARISRDFSDMMYYISDLKRQGFVIHSISDSVPQGLEGDLLLGVKAYANAKFLQDLRRNIRRGLHYVVKTHGAHIGTVPIGYLKESLTIGQRRDGSPHIISRLVVDEATAPFVRRAFEMRAMGSTYSEIHSEFHLYGWHLSYKRLFSNSVYTGTLSFGGEIIPNYCPPIISLDVWNSVQKVQDARKARNGYNHPRALRSRFWLTGVLFCSRCGKPMHGHSIHKKGEKPYDYYICTSKVTFEPCGSMPIRKDKLEALVMDALHTIIDNPGILSDIYKLSQAHQRDKDGLRNSQSVTLRQSVTNNEKQIKRVLDAIKDAGHSRTLLIELNLLETQQVELQQQIMKFDSRVDSHKPLLLMDDIINSIQTALDTADERKRVIILRGFEPRIECLRLDHKFTGKMALSLGDGETTINL